MGVRVSELFIQRSKSKIRRGVLESVKKKFFLRGGGRVGG